MSLNKVKATIKPLTFIVLLSLFVAVQIAILLFVFHNYQKKVTGTIKEVSSIYVEEIANREIVHLQDNIDSQFFNMKANADMLSLSCSSLEDVKVILGKMQEDYDYDVLALIDSEGYYLSSTEYKPAISKINSLNKLLNDRTSIISFNESFSGDDVILFGLPVKDFLIEQEHFVAIVAGVHTSDFINKMSLQSIENNTSTSIIKRDGSFIVDANLSSLAYAGTNLFSVLEKRAIIDEEYSVEKMKEDMAKGKEGLITFTQDGKYLFLYYAPVPNTDWYVSARMPYGKINSIVTTLTRATTFVGIYVVCIILALIVAICVYNVNLVNKRNEEKNKLELQEKIVATKNDFLAKMSHDIRTPLNGIIGMNYIASTQIDKSNVEALKCLKKVDASSKYLLSIINDILDMSKIESGKMIIASKPFSLTPLLVNIYNMLESQGAEKGLQFKTDFPSLEEYDYKGDPLRLNQILMNLLSNAFKFTVRGFVSFTVTNKRQDEKTDLVTFKIADTGIGMSQEYLETIFSPFVQENEQVAESFGGSGLGLSIVKHLVDLMQGTIEVDSTKDVGTTFTVSIPLERVEKLKATTVVEPVKKSEISFVNKRVLLAEDHKINAQIATKILNMLGLTVELAQNGKVAVDKFVSSPDNYYDLILMDIRMPYLNGLDAAKMIRASSHPKAKIIPICAMSANAFDDDVEISLKAGMNDHLKKPIEVNILKDTLSKFLSD